jgi:hypothetical protein
MAFMDFLPQFGDNTDTTSSDDATLQQINLKRKLALADSLRNTPELQGQMVSGRYVAPAWTQSLANVANKYIGNKISENAMKEYGTAQKAEKAKLSNAFNDYIAGKSPKDITTTLDNFVTQPLQEGANVPTSPFQTNEQVGQVAPNYAGQAPVLNMTGNTTVNQPITSTMQVPRTKQEQMANALKYINATGNTDLSSKAVLGDIENMFKAPETNLGKVEIDKFTPQSISKFKETGSYSDLVPVTKASTKYTNITQDKLGNSFGFNTETQKIEQLPGATMAKDNWSEPYKVGNQFLQRNSASGEVRNAYDSGEKQVFTQTTELRNDFNNLPQVKSWNVIEPVLLSARTASKDNTGASDLNMIYALGKVLDPNSVVREGELEMAGNTGSLGQKIAGYYKSVNSGGRLTPQIKEDLLRQIESRTYSQRQQYEAAKSKYTEIAKKNKLDPNDLFINTVVEPVDVTKGKVDPNIEKQQAMEWINANPNDPRVPQIKKRLGL